MVVGWILVRGLAFHIGLGRPALDENLLQGLPQLSPWPQPNVCALIVHLAHAVGEVAEQSEAGEGAWGVAHALSRRFAPTLYL